MDFVYSLLLILITGLIYMALPILFVKFRGKVSRGKAFLLAFLNWFIIHFILISVYGAIFPGEADSLIYSGPVLWLYISWKYLSIKKTANNRKANTKSTNSISDLERKFKINFYEARKESFTRETIKFALFAFQDDQSISRIGKIITLVVVKVQGNDYRYFAVESSIGNSSMLCEWTFDKNDQNTGHLNYGGVAISKINTLTQEVIVGDEVLIDQIHTIINMNSKPEFTSSKKDSGWVGTSNI